MAMRVETNPLEAAYAALLSQGLDGAGEALRILVDEASKIERSHHLNAGPHQRSEDRSGYANGFKPKTVLTRMGEITFAVPQSLPRTPIRGSRQQLLSIRLGQRLAHRTGGQSGAGRDVHSGCLNAQGD